MTTCPNNRTVVLENMSDGHISTSGNRRKVCYKHNIADFLWTTFLFEGNVVWYFIGLWWNWGIHFSALIWCTRFFLIWSIFTFEPPTLSPYKNGIGWLKYECLSDIINFRSLLLKADFRIFHFELETPLNKLVKLYSYFFWKNNFE